MPSEALLFSPCGMVTATALKWRGASVTVGNLVAAITVRVIVDGADGVCALAEMVSAALPSSSIPVIGIRILASSTNDRKHHTRSFHGKAPVSLPLFQATRRGEPSPTNSLSRASQRQCPLWHYAALSICVVMSAAGGSRHKPERGGFSFWPGRPKSCTAQVLT